MTPLYQLKQLYLATFRKNKRARALNSLKEINSVSEARQVISSLSVAFPKIWDEVKGCIYPQTAKDMCNKAYTFFKPDSILSEINWFITYSGTEWDKLKWFVWQKMEFEHNFLIGNFSLCHDVLRQIKEELGISLWYYEANCLLLEYEGKRSDALEYVSKLLKECDDNKNYIPSLIYYLYQRTTRTLSPYKFDEDLNALYKRNKTDLHEDYYKYILFRLNFYNHYDNIDLSLPIMFESLASIVDRYLMVVNVLKSCLSANPYDRKILSRAKHIYSKTSDPNLTSCLVPHLKKLPESYISLPFINILDSYYAGDYDACIRLCTEFMERDSSNFDVCIFYCRSLVYLGKGFLQPQKGKNTPIGKVCDLIYKIITYENANDNIYKLYQINKNLYSFYISSALNNFVKIESNEGSNGSLKAISCRTFDPFYTKLLKDRNEALAYIRKGLSVCPNSLACKVWEKRISFQLVGDLSIPLHIKLPIDADYYYKRKNYEESKKVWEQLYYSATDYVPVRQKAMAHIIDCLFEAGKYQLVIKRYVDTYIKDPAAVTKVDTRKIITYFQEHLYEDIRRNIELVIFVALTCKISVDKSFVLFEFCELYHKSKPSELIELLLPTIALDKVELFFSLINDDETLRHYLNIGSYKDRLVERKKNLVFLASLNSPNKEDYLVQLKAVEDALLVYNLSRNLDESKIYANDSAIINHKLNNIDGLYNRYLLLLDTVISKHKNIYWVNMNQSYFFENHTGYDTEAQTHVSINTDGLYEVFNSLYAEIKEQFLNSDYGLVAYLSTRVRHGELETQLRPELEVRNLILFLRDEDYQDNMYWANTYALSSHENRLINDELKKFTKRFDDAVTFLIKQKLQIYDSKNKKEGLFKYTYDENKIAFKAYEIGLQLLGGKKDKKYFSELMIRWLWEMTEISLVSVRNYIEHDFKTNIVSSLEALEEAVKQNVPEGYCKTEILLQLKNASEALLLKIDKVSKWFFVSHPKLEDTDFKIISHQIFNAVKAAHASRPTNAQLVIKGDTFKIKACFAMHYADIIRTVLINIFDHGVIDANGKYPMSLNIDIKETTIEMLFSNPTDKDDELLNAIFEEKLKDVQSVFGEGGSGIAKVNKILKRDLACNDNYISMKAEKNICYTRIVIYLRNFKSI